MNKKLLKTDLKTLMIEQGLIVYNLVQTSKLSPNNIWNNSFLRDHTRKK